MKVPDIPENEPQRLAALERYQILDTPPEQAFDDLTWLAQQVTGAPIVLVSLVDAHRQWFKSKQGLEACETHREISFCGHAIHDFEPLEVADASEDPRFSDNPLVIGAPNIRFYFGVPLTTPDQLNLGTLCVIDVVPRKLEPHQVEMLKVIARQVISQLELRLAGRRMREAFKQAREASQAKSRFLANMSHEIRTPMNGVIGMTELVLRNNLSDEQRQQVEIIKNSAEILMRLLNDILDFSKIEAGKLDFERVGFHLERRLEALRRSHELGARKKGIELQLEVAEHLPARVLADPLRLEQVLNNLIGNAIKFSSGGKVIIRVVDARPEKSDPDHLRLAFSVEDQGIGIEADKQQLIFEAFSQANQSITRFFGGTGLGLAICSRLVEMMGGRIWVRSQPGEGSTFTFEIPVQEATDAPSESGDGSRAAEVLPQPADEMMSPAKLSPQHILLVEDNPINQIVARDMLENLGHSVALVENGQAALKAFGNHHFDLILMDLQMPEMDGIQTTRAIRELEKEREGHTPIVAMTASAMKGDEERCFAAGMDGYVAKPLTLDRFEREVARVLVGM
ncbi:Response regulator [Sulfidibacter corallicola]|uniref:Sensory/regulatory protein RpfC n=1 Tax=Sulfidibacter corallicola TaxID=2818388 RepID=A0A8A4TRV4_SULCO|nr:GAF domain-containing hybrid sensor histidine kinase/response regulator [Sulfidibacter corallicola]QTD52127.1 response regulator [Sulfidibacter corallicola]